MRARRQRPRGSRTLSERRRAERRRRLRTRLLPLVVLVLSSLTAGALSLAATSSPPAAGSGLPALPAEAALAATSSPEPTTGDGLPGGTTEPARAAPTEPEPGPSGGTGTDEAPEAEPPTALEAPLVEQEGFPAIRWRASRSLGSHTAGRLVNGVLLPAVGEGFLTWDPIRGRTPNRAWRRWGSDQLIRTMLDVFEAYGQAHPDAAPLVVGDLSRPRGGAFGSRFGGLGHVSHQNGLDVDIYYPRRDGAARPPATPAQIDRALARHLVRLWLRAGAKFVFVGFRTGLAEVGPRTRVQAIGYHNDHMHVRLRRAGR